MSGKQLTERELSKIQGGAYPSGYGITKKQGEVHTFGSFHGCYPHACDPTQDMLEPMGTWQVLGRIR